eukprot:7742857-Pyramimonas_sp.AAC.1
MKEWKWLKEDAGTFKQLTDGIDAASFAKTPFYLRMTTELWAEVKKSFDQNELKKELKVIPARWEGHPFPTPPFSPLLPPLFSSSLLLSLIHI